jgi:tRNA uridine 5-carbamoylmethylation protein Kti12
MKNKLIILRWLPGSGKTTFSNKFIESHPNFKRVCGDNLIYMMGGKPVGWVSEIELTTADLLLHNGNWVIVDSINESEAQVNNLKRIAYMNDVDYTVITLKTPLPKCIENSKMKLSPTPTSKIKSLFDNYFKRLYA